MAHLASVVCAEPSPNGGRLVVVIVRRIFSSSSAAALLSLIVPVNYSLFVARFLAQGGMKNYTGIGRSGAPCLRLYIYIGLLWLSPFCFLVKRLGFSVLLYVM